MTETLKTDFLVLGSGIAGLRYALEAAKNGTVIIVTKKDKAESNTNYAQGGIASVFSNEDDFDQHIRDTLIAGAGLCHKEAVSTLVKEGPNRIKELIEIGAQFTQQDGKLHLGREGGHSRDRIVHSKDFTGREIERALLQEISRNSNISLFENHIGIDLITEHNLLDRSQKRDTNQINCWGAYILDANTGIVKNIIKNYNACNRWIRTGLFTYYKSQNCNR